uniref:ATP-dependent DNA helicase n=1 Tax=Lactuca sativa TaxID=4236 RepID=A0A9R1X0I3_LACSA|nr:hypothetical protein LSAT_V11C800425610 [Lactuca sativa]
MFFCIKPIIYDAISHGDTEIRCIGKCVLLPPSFVGGPRYMYNHYQDALSICREYGTIFYNLYIIEFQKRGLPHCHALIWVADSHKIKEPSAIDAYITVALPDPVCEALLYETITRCLIHGPCGLLNTEAPCMKDVFDKDGYVHYKKDSVAFHTYIVPYNKRLCSRFNAHINVEYCGWNMMIKYLFKYVSKRMERVRFKVWYLMRLRITLMVVSSVLTRLRDQDPSVVILPVHLRNMQSVFFKENTCIKQVVENLSFGSILLLGWFDKNKWDAADHDLTYASYLTKYWWDKNAKAWKKRKRSTFHALGKFIFVHSSAGELFYLRMLLSYHKGCNCNEDLRTVSNTLYSVFHGACDAHISCVLYFVICSFYVMLMILCLYEETTYDKEILTVTHEQMLSSLNKLTSTKTTQSVEEKGTGKTFLWTTLLAHFRSRGKIKLVVVASGIASLLLPSGRTAHSMFNILIDFSDNVACNITKRTMLVELLRRTSIIIWDEAPMSDRRCFESLDRSLRDILECETKVFGGMSLLLGWDFRQTLPVSPRSTPSEIISLTLPDLYLWSYFKLYKLNDNMSLKNFSNSLHTDLSVPNFASWLLKVGDGVIGEIDAFDKTNTIWIEIPHSLIIPPS